MQSMQRQGFALALVSFCIVGHVAIDIAKYTLTQQPPDPKLGPSVALIYFIYCLCCSLLAWLASQFAQSMHCRSLWLHAMHCYHSDLLA